MITCSLPNCAGRPWRSKVSSVVWIFGRVLLGGDLKRALSFSSARSIAGKFARMRSGRDQFETVYFIQQLAEQFVNQSVRVEQMDSGAQLGLRRRPSQGRQ